MKRAALNNLRRQRRENVRLPRARDSGNAKPSAIVEEDLLLGGTRGKEHISLQLNFLDNYVTVSLPQ